LEEDVGDAGRFGRGIEEVGVESTIEYRDHEGVRVTSAEDFPPSRHTVGCDDTANVDVGPQDGIAVRSFDGVDRLSKAEGCSVEAGRCRGSIFEPGKASNIVP
jgi:hypothetical protein